jgi:hypothetical protein
VSEVEVWEDHALEVLNGMLDHIALMREQGLDASRISELRVMPGPGVHPKCRSGAVPRAIDDQAYISSMRLLRAVWAGLRYDLARHRDPQPDGYFPAWDPTIPKGISSHSGGDLLGEQ